MLSIVHRGEVLIWGPSLIEIKLLEGDLFQVKPPTNLPAANMEGTTIGIE